jgi:DNA-binding response OmpR family regulator
MNVLVVEDDKRIAYVLEQSLTEDGHRVFVSHRGDEGADLMVSSHFDLVVLDIMLPGIDGFTILRRIRSQKCTVPVLVLTARDEMPDMVRGLDLGADDYLTKPFQLDNLLARVRAIGRRGHKASDNNIVAGEITLDREQRLIKRGAEEIALSRKEFLILDLLMRRMNKAVPRSQIIETGWGFDADVSDNSVEFYVSSLRSKIDQEGRPSFIRTVRTIGYCFVFSSAS